LDFSQLIFDDARVVEQPLLRGRRLAPILRAAAEDLVRLEHAAPRQRETTPQRPRRGRSRGLAVGLRELDGVRVQVVARI
jgi:hypothetical protein